MIRMRPLSRRSFARGRVAATGRDRDTVDVVLFDAAAAFSARDLAGCQRLVSEGFDRATSASYRLGRERACLWRGTITASLGRFDGAKRECDMLANSPERPLRACAGSAGSAARAYSGTSSASQSRGRK